eukprot:Skav219061  [mRNA]  locus=scaffold1033:55391:57142:- [translate_table: standard]
MTLQLQSCTLSHGPQVTCTKSSQSSHRIWRLLILVLVQGTQGLPTQLQITNGIIALNGLVKVRVKSHLLDILLLAQFHKTLTRSIAGVENLLQQVKHQICWAILAIPLTQVFHQIRLIDHARALLGILHDGLSAHATTLCSKVDAFSGAFGDVACRIAHQNGAVLDTPRARVLRNRVSLHADDFTALNARGRSVADTLLVPLDALLVHHGASANGHMIALGEDPGIEVRGNVLTNVHLCSVLVVVHLWLWNAHTLLKGNGIFIVPSLNILGHTAVGTICTDHHIDFQGLLFTLARVALFTGIVVVGQHIGLALFFWEGHSHEKSVDQGGSVLLGSLPQKVIQHLSTNHANVLVILQSLADLNLLVGG